MASHVVATAGPEYAWFTSRGTTAREASMATTVVACTRCGATIDDAAIDRTRDIATCAACGTLVDVRLQLAAVATEHPREREPVDLPAGMRIERGVGGNVTLTRRWLRSKHIVFVIIVAAASAGLAWAWREYGASVGVIIGVVFVGTWYLRLLGVLINSTRIEARGGEVHVSHGPLPSLMFKPAHVRAEQIEQLYAARFGALYEVKAALGDGSTLSLVRPLVSPEQAIFVEQQLEAALGLTDAPIEGELERGTPAVASSGGVLALAIVPLVALPLVLVFFMGSSRIEGTLEGSGDEGAWAIAPEHCTSGEPRGYFGVELSSRAAPSTRVRIIRDAAMGPMVVIEHSDTAPTTLMPAQCDLMELDVEQTNSSYNDVWIVRGSAAIDCPGIRGTVTFAGCH